MISARLTVYKGHLADLRLVIAGRSQARHPVDAVGEQVLSAIMSHQGSP